MREMTEFSGSPTDAVAVRERIAADGYVLLRRLVDPDRAIAVAEDVRRPLVDGGWLAAGGRAGTALRSVVAGREPEDFWPLYARVLGVESVNALPWDDALVATLQALLGPTAFTFPMKTPRTVFPAVGDEATPVHRDGRTGPWVGDMFTTWVALDDVPPELGGLAVLRGSQTYRHGAVPDGPGAASGGPGIPGLESPDWVTTSFRAGDVLLFHCYTVHRGLPNRSDRVRISADYRWKASGEPMHVSTLLPYRYFDRYPAIPGWRELSQGWSRPDWCAYPAGTEVIYSKLVGGRDNLVPRSRFVQVRPGASELWREELRAGAEFALPHELPPAYDQPPHALAGRVSAAG